MERQSSSSSSSRNSFGCMSAIFRLLSKHDKRSKFLTSGKEQQKETAHAQSPIEAYEQRLKAAKLPRSPTLPAEMRRSKSVEIPPHAHALVVARLMGLESSEEKRMKLLRALEQCDEELKSLQRITEVVNNRSVSVGDIGRTLQLQQKNPLKKKPGEEEITATGACFFHRFTKESVSYAKSKNHRDHDNSINAFSALWRISKAMVRSVDEVCKDIAWGERREIGRIGLVLQDHICRDLIDEIVIEMGCYVFASISSM
ncbi:hypothetical protein REPUB_Repub06bG0103100 [Reevesia pubescens]